MPSKIENQLQKLKSEIANECHLCHRSPDSVTLLGIIKKQPTQRISAVIQAGLTDIGENYVQEAQNKLSLLPPVRKHFVGHIQTNKAKKIVELFDVVQTIDRPDAAIALAKAAEAQGKILPVLIQINISATERFGCLPENSDQLAAIIRKEPSLFLDGVMAIAPLNADEAERLHAFKIASRLFNQIGGTTLSLGMSNDWKLAIQAGSTMVRIGTALFGER